MKKKISLLVNIFIFFCFFSTKLYSEISDYKIAGVSLKTSILGVMSEDEIIENLLQKSWAGDQYVMVNFNKDLKNFPELKNFDMVYFTINTKEEILPIVAITMYKKYQNNFAACMKEQKLLANKYEKIFKIKKEEFPIQDFSERYGPGSKWKSIIFEKPNFQIIKSDTASVLCYHYGTSAENELYGQDNLKVNILTREFANAATIK